jgi:hypothetical protein
MSPVKYELGFYIPEDDILHSHRRESLKSYTVSLCLHRRRPRGWLRRYATSWKVPGFIPV